MRRRHFEGWPIERSYPFDTARRQAVRAEHAALRIARMIARSGDRKAQILDAAMARIVACGVEGLRIRDVAQDVGINNATLLHHFPTKAALVTALVHRFVAGFSLDDSVPDEGTLDERLRAYVEKRHALMRRDPKPFLVLDELMVLARRDDEIRASLLGLQEHWGGYLVAVGRDAGLDEAAALERADRCRRELLGTCLELCLVGSKTNTEGESR